LNNKKKLPGYLKVLLRNHPKIASGRKNFTQNNYRISKTLDIIKKYFNLKIEKR